MPSWAASRWCKWNAMMKVTMGEMHFERSGEPRAWDYRSTSEAELAALGIGDVLSAADHVRSQRYRVRHSDVDLLGDPDRVIDLDPAPYAPTSGGRRSFHCVARS
jgi:hypothetical protein